VHSAAIKAIAPKLRLEMATATDLRFSSDTQVKNARARKGTFSPKAMCACVCVCLFLFF
jgi:hypothetical protein